MKKEQFTINSLHAVIWQPTGEIKAVLQIIHGMTEHIGRYEEFAAALCHHGIAVAGFDLRGHGQNPGNPEIASFGVGGWTAAIEDMHDFSDHLWQCFPEAPHAHYNNNAYKKPFRYLSYDKYGYSLNEGEWGQLFQELVDANIPYSIEPGVSLQSCEEVLQLCAEYPDRIFPAMGIHPTRSIYEKWSDRKKLDTYAKTPGVIAIGECGLDYHYKREEQHRLKQHIWFLYQLDLAWRLKKPVILHVRDAHEDALRILKWHPARKLGGVIHCFYGSWEIAQQYLKLGYHFGIGGSLLQQEERAGALWEAVKHIPLDKILVETDAPFILPYCKDVIQPKLLRRAKNTSLILPAVIEKIADLKHG